MNEIAIKTATGIAVACLQATTVWTIVQRRRHRQFPVFLAYASASALIESGLIMMAHLTRPQQWINLYWTLQVIYTVLGILAMHESFRKILLPYFPGKRWFDFLVPGIVLAITVLSAWKMLQRPQGASGQFDLLYFAFFLASDYVRATIFGLFAVLVIFWRARWQPCAFGVMKGFGFYTIVGMLADLLRSDFGTKTTLFFVHAPAVAYLVACLIWMGAFLQREPENGSGKTGSLTNVDEVLELLTRIKKALE